MPSSNFLPRRPCKTGVPLSDFWREALNSDGLAYGGSGVGNLGGVEAAAAPLHGRPYSLILTLPPLAVVFFINNP